MTERCVTMPDRRPSAKRMMWRGLTRRCALCGSGKLFRKWATQMLVQLAKHGFVVDKRRLKGDTDRLAKLREIIRGLRVPCVASRLSGFIRAPFLS